MKAKRYILLLTLLLVPLWALGQDDDALYREAVGSSSLFWRGHKAFSYPALVTGTPWWEDVAFESGTVVFNGRTYSNIPLNIDAVRQDLVARDVATGVDKVVWRDGVTRFSMGGKVFLHLQAIYGEGMPSGYWQVLYGGHAKFVKQVIITTFVKHHLLTNPVVRNRPINNVIIMPPRWIPAVAIGEDEIRPLLRICLKCLHFQFPG